MELIFNPCGEFRWSPECLVSKIYSPHLHVGVPGIFSGLLRSVQMIKREWGAKSNGELQYLFISDSWICGGTPAFGLNCSLGAWVCSERPALGQNTLIIYTALGLHMQFQICQCRPPVYSFASLPSFPVLN